MKLNYKTYLLPFVLLAASAGEVQGFADIGSLGFKAIKIPVAGRQTGPVLARPLEAEADDE